MYTYIIPYYILLWEKNIPKDTNTVRLYVMIFLKNCMHINLHYWTIQSQFSYRFFSAIYYTLNLSLDFLVTLNLYIQHSDAVLFFFSCFNTFPLQVYAPCTSFICCHDNGDRLIVLYSAVFLFIFWSLAAVIVKAMYRNSNVCS